MNPLLHAIKVHVFEPLQRALAIPPKRVIPLFSVALGYRVDGDFTQHGIDHDSSDDINVKRRLWGGHIAFGGSHTKSLYYNAALFLRVNFPFGIFIGVRWAGKSPERVEFAHLGFGWKLNGDFAFTARAQSDISSAAGVSGPNVGQAQGWSEGTK